MENSSNTFLTTQKLPQVFNYSASPVLKRLCSYRENARAQISKGTPVLLGIPALQVLEGGTTLGQCTY